MSLLVGNCLFNFVQECHIHDFFMKRCSGRVKVKLNLNNWKTKIQSGQRVAVFPMMNKMNETNGINSIVQSEAVDHFNSLIEEFHRYFPGVEHDTPMMALNKKPFQSFC